MLFRSWPITAIGAASVGTDGRDVPTDAAGGIITASQDFDQTAARAALLSHNSYNYLKAHDQLLMVGATGTNLADLVLIIAQDWCFCQGRNAVQNDLPQL